jgi:hypothetical protein
MKRFAGKLCMVTILVMSCLPSFSQMAISGSEVMLDKLRLNKGIKGMNDVEYSAIQGEPFIFRNFKIGSLIASNGEKFNIEVRYDMYANEMHIKNKDEIFAIIHPEKVKLIEADDIKFIYSQYAKGPGENSNGDSSYFILSTDGKCKLLVKKNVRIQEAEPPKLYQEAKPAKFVATTDLYYLKINENDAIKIKNEKELLIVLADKESEIKIFIKTNHLGVSKIEDLSKIVSYYNSL